MSSSGTQPQAQYYSVLNGTPPCFGRAANVAVIATAANISQFALTGLPGVPADFYAQSVIIDARNAVATSQVQFGNNQFNINVAPETNKAYTIPAFATGPNIKVVFENSTDTLFMIFANYEIEPQDYQGSAVNGQIVVPSTLTYTDATITSTGASQQAVSGNPNRYKLIIGAPFGGIVWVNFTGGAAGPGLPGCFPIFPGCVYESDETVPANAVNVYCSPAGLNIPINVG